MNKPPDNPQSLLLRVQRRDPRAIGRAISWVENRRVGYQDLIHALSRFDCPAQLCLGVTGGPGVGKSTLINRLISEYRSRGHRVGVLAVDPSSPTSGGALLGDRIRMMEHSMDSDVIIRSLASRWQLGGLCECVPAVVRILSVAGCSRILVETVGVGQNEFGVVRIADLTLLVLAPGLGDEVQAMKAGLLELADVMIVNKADLSGADKLKGEMEEVALAQKSQLCVTNSLTGDGIAILVNLLEDLALRSSGVALPALELTELDHRTLEGAMVLLRERLQELLPSLDTSTSEPEERAQELVRALLEKAETAHS